MSLRHIVDKAVGFDSELLDTMGVNLARGILKLSGKQLTEEDIAERISKFSPSLGIEAARMKVPENLEKKFRVRNGAYQFVEHEQDGVKYYRLELYEGEPLLNKVINDLISYSY
jgi:hypothetical protein